MANRYWAAGVTGNWNSTASWSSTSDGLTVPASVPGSSDAAIFNAASGTVTATLDISPTVQTLTCTGFTGTLAFGTNTITLNATGTIFTGATSMSVSGTPLIICTATTTTVARTVSPQSVTEANSISFRFTNSTAGLTLSGGSYRDLDFTDGTNPTGFGGALAVNANTIYGSFKASTNMSATPGTSTLTFAATSGTKTINTAGVTFDRPFTFNGVGGTWQLQGALTSGNTRTTTLTAGTLDLNDNTLTTGTFTGSGSGVRSIISGTGFFSISGDSATVVSMGTTTNLTSDTYPLFLLTYAGSTGTRTVSVGIGTNLSSAPDIHVANGSDTFTTSGTSTVHDLIFQAGFTGTLGNATRNIYGSLTMHSGMATPTSGSLINTFNGTNANTIDSGGKPLDFPVQFNGTGTWTLQQDLLVGPSGTPSTRTLTINAGNVVLNNFSITAGLIDASSSSTRSIAFGSSGKLVANGVGAINALLLNTSTGLTYTGTSRIEITGAASAGTTRVVNGPQESTGGSEANAMNVYITAGSDTINLGTVSRIFGTVDFTGFAGTWSSTSNATIYGNLVLTAGMTYGATSPTGLLFASTSATPRTITTAGKTFNCSVTFDGIGGTWAFQDALTMASTKALTLTNGTLQLKSGTTNTVGSFVTPGSNQIYLQATTPGVQATISAASGTNNAYNITLRDSNATGGATWRATNSSGMVDGGNNSGWVYLSWAIINNSQTPSWTNITQP